MPRHNHTKKVQRQLPYAKNEQQKTAYPSKQAANNAIAHIMIYRPDITLRTYQSPHDGKWYLTSEVI
ncbi:MAG: hypothetical protein WAQ22_04635 [Candidatus Saccharimonas sp.]